MSNGTSRFLEEVVSDSTSTGEKVELLNSEILPEIVTEFNEGEASERLTRLTRDIEPVPNHSRNVTETRTRVGLLLEFNLGIVIEEYLPENHIVSYGASQAHTDLVLRGPNRHPTVRLEIKAIEDIAEEKAASYEDLIHSIDPRRDILAIFTWGWQIDFREGTETRIPELYDLKAFEMREISMARDLFWMQSPRGDNRNMIEVSMPVIQRTPRELKEEEGNMGKLTRIVNSTDLEENPELETLLNFDELKRYIKYMSFCKGVGVTRAAEHYMLKVGHSFDQRDDPLFYKANECQFVNYGTLEGSSLLIFSGGGSIVYGGNLVNPIEDGISSKMLELDIQNCEVLVIDNEKFNWTRASAELKDFSQPNSLETTLEERGDNLFGDIIGRTPI